MCLEDRGSNGFMRKYIALFLLLVSQAAFSQNKNTITVSGLITDTASGETLIGAGATVGKDGAVTNNFGFYSLSIHFDSNNSSGTNHFLKFRTQ